MPFLIWLVIVGLTLYCLLDVALADPQEVRNLPKVGWLLIVLFFPGFGAIAWLYGGRPTAARATPGGGGEPRRRGPVPRGRPGRPDRPGRPPAGAHPTQPRGPDDDPEFLRKLDDELRRGRRDDGGGDG